MPVDPRSPSPTPVASPGQEHPEPGSLPAPVPDVDAEPDSGALSPLMLVTSEPVINAFIAELSRARAAIMEAPHDHHVLRFSRAEVRHVREAYAATVRIGEASLHRLCELLATRWFQGDYSLQSVVIGEIEHTTERFKLSQPLTIDELYARTDLDLGNRQLERLRFQLDDGLHGARLVSNSVEYQPLVHNTLNIHKMISRIKAEEELWNKVCDEIFELDRLVQRDKQLRELSRYVKDVFGVKIIVEDHDAARRVLEALRQLSWSDDELTRCDVPTSDASRQLALVELKDYMNDQKNSGWGALKTVLRWNGKTFEFQIQTADAYHRELLFLTRESHASHKARRERLREEIGRTIPLFSFYLELLRWLFIETSGPPPELDNVEIIVTE